MFDILKQFGVTADTPLHTKKAVRLPGIPGRHYLTGGTAMRLSVKVDDVSRSTRITGYISANLKINNEVHRSPEVFTTFAHDAEQSLRRLHQVIQLDPIMAGLTLEQFVLHGEFFLAEGKKGPYFQVRSITSAAILPYVWIGRLNTGDQIDAKIETGKGQVPISTLIRNTMSVFYRGKRITSISIDNPKQINLLGAQFKSPEEMIEATCYDLVKGPIMLKGGLTALPKLRTNNVLPTYRSLYNLYSAYCEMHGRKMAIPFPKTERTEFWSNFGRTITASVAIEAPEEEIVYIAIEAPE